MEESKTTPKSMDEYIIKFPADIQEKLEALRKIIKEAAPEATEKISYQMPTFYLYGNLVHFAAFKKHIGFFPTSSGIAAFEKVLSPYKGGKGSVQFPFEKAIPYELISEIVKYRVAENIKKQEFKKRKNF